MIERARSILQDLEAGALPGGAAKPVQGRSRDGQLSLALAPKRSPRRAAETTTLEALRELDANAMTPLDALTWVARAKEELAAADAATGEEGTT